MRQGSVQPPVYQQQTAPYAVAGAVFALAGGALIAAGALLPWADEIDVSLNRNAFQLGNNLATTVVGPALLGIGVLTVIIGVIRLANATLPRYVQGSTVVTGLIAGGFIISNYPQAPNRSVVTTIGYGYWVCAIGAGLAFLGGLMMHKRNAQSVSSWLVAAVVVVVLLIIGAGAALAVHDHQTSSSRPSVATTTYPASLRTDFLSNCDNNGGTSAQCGCAFSYLERHVSLTEFEAEVQQVQIDGNVPKSFLNAVANCPK